MRLIDADVMREDWLENGENEHVYDTNAFLASIDEQPTIEAVPVVHGEWIESSSAGWKSYDYYCAPQLKCSRCGKEAISQTSSYREQGCGSITERRWIKTDWCPNCGADMRKKV